MQQTKKIKTREIEDDSEIAHGLYRASMKKIDDRNKVIPKHIMSEIRKVYNQRDLAEFFDTQKFKSKEPEPRPDTRTKKETQQRINANTKKDHIEEVIGVAAAKIARDISANCVISVEKSKQQTEDQAQLGVKVVIFKKQSMRYEKLEYNTKIGRKIFGSIIPIKELLIEAINKRYLVKDDRIVCVVDESVGMGYKGMLFIFDVDKIFFNMSTHHLTDKISTEVLETAINIAMEISNEGREGKKIGTAFVIGNKSEILKHTKQMIINPFANSPEGQCRITDPNLKETIKGFAQLDGCFVIHEDGTIITAGAYINADPNLIDTSKFQGFGTRHRCCAALTKMTDAIAIVISESGGVVRIFKDGNIIMKLP